MKKQYDAIVRGDASAWNYPYPGWCVPDQPQQNIRSCYRNEWAAYVFAQRWGGREGVDVKKLQRIVLTSGNPACAIEYARHISGANVRRLQDVVLRLGNASQMRRFALLVADADVDVLRNTAIVAEVMGV